MANISTGDGLSKTVESASKAVSSAADQARVSDRPDAKFVDLADKPVSQVIDGIQNESAKKGATQDVQSSSAQGRIGQAIKSISDSISAIPDLKEADQTRDEFSPPNTIRLLIEIAADLSEFKEYVESGSGLLLKVPFNHGHFLSVPDKCTSMDLKGIAGHNISTMTKAPHDFGLKLQKGFGAGDLMGFVMPALASMVFLKGACNLLRPGIRSALSFVNNERSFVIR